MSIISGIAKRFDGTAIDYVSIFNWTDGKCIAQVEPDASGNWEYEYFAGLNVGITYVADGCEPITHGAYELVYDASSTLEGLVLHYRFNGDANDSSIHDNNANILAGVPTFVEGRKVGSLCANTAGGSFVTSKEVTLGTKQLTLCFWAKFLLPNTRYQTLIESLSKHIGVWYGDTLAGHLSMSVNSSSNLYIRDTSQFTPSDWNFFELSVDTTLDTATAIKIYINNTEVSNARQGSAVNEVIASDMISIGRRQGTQFKFDGLIQDMRIYNRILTNDERLFLFSE